MCRICRADDSVLRPTVKPVPHAPCIALLCCWSASAALYTHPPWTTGGGMATGRFSSTARAARCLSPPALQKAFGQSTEQRPGCGFPLAHLLGLFHAGTG